MRLVLAAEQIVNRFIGRLCWPRFMAIRTERHAQALGDWTDELFARVQSSRRTVHLNEKHPEQFALLPLSHPKMDLPREQFASRSKSGADRQTDRIWSCI